MLAGSASIRVLAWTLIDLMRASSDRRIELDARNTPIRITELAAADCALRVLERGGEQHQLTGDDDRREIEALIQRALSQR